MPWSKLIPITRRERGGDAVERVVVVVQDDHVPGRAEAGAGPLVDPLLGLGHAASHSRSSVWRARPCAPLELGAELADRAVALRDHVVGVDRLQVDLARPEEVGVARGRGTRSSAACSACAHGVLDEARLKVGVLDDEQLVGALEQLVDGGAHRLLDDLDQVLGVDRAVGADVERAAAALVVRRERDELEDAVDVRLVEAGLERGARLAWPRTSPCAHGQALIPVASTPTTRLLASCVAAAIPISETISWVRMRVTGVSRWIG